MPMRTVALPGMWDIDISPIMSIIDHFLFQALRLKKQLGTVFWSFPDAQHSRFDHSLGTYALTQKRAERWVNQRWITPEEAVDLCLFGLLHDIGHGPYSHQTEGLCSISHNQRALIVLEELRPVILQCGGNFDRIRAMFIGESPLAVAVKHDPLGTDRLDYLVRDYRHTNGGGGLVLPYSQFVNYTSFDRERAQLIVDRKIVHEVMQAQRFYIFMYDRVYRRKSCQISQRFLEKVVSLLMQVSHGSAEPPELTEAVLWTLTDPDLDALIAHSRNATVLELNERRKARQLPRVAISIRPDPWADEERRGEKAIARFGVPEEQFARLAILEDRRVTEEVEAAIAQLMHIPPQAVLVIPVTDINRFVAGEILVQDPGNEITTLRRIRPAHYASLAEMARAYCAVRVCVFEEYRARVARRENAEAIRDLLLARAAA